MLILSLVARAEKNRCAMMSRRTIMLLTTIVVMRANSFEDTNNLGCFLSYLSVIFSFVKDFGAPPFLTLIADLNNEFRKEVFLTAKK